MTSASARVSDAAPLLKALEEAQRPSRLLAQRKKLGQIMRDGVPPPEFLPSPTLAERLFYKRQLAILSGHRKHGKSTATKAVCADAMRAGHPVVYLDFENGEDIITERLVLMGLEPEIVDELFHYVPFPTGLSLDDWEAELRRVTQELPGALLVYDSYRGLFSRLRTSSGAPLSVNDPIDTEAVFGPINSVTKTEDVLASLMIDHAKKGGQASDIYSTANSVGKEQAVDAVYFWEKREPFSEDQAGVVSLTVTADRRGRLPTQPLLWRVGGQGPGNPLCFEPVSQDEIGTPARIRADVLDFLRAQPGEQFTQSAVVKAVQGNADAKRQALNALAADPDVPVHRVAGKRKDHPKYVYDPDRTKNAGATKEPPL